MAAPAILLALSCGGGENNTTPTAPTAPRPTARELTGFEAVVERTAIRVGQTVGPLVAYGRYDDGTTGAVEAAWTSSDPNVVGVGEDATVTGAGVGTAAVSAVFEEFSDTLEFEVEEPNQRSTRDQPDDISGPQIHAVYALPSDAEDGNLDRFGDIERSFEAIQNWLSADIGYRLRLDTYDGALDATFLRLPFTEEEGEARSDSLVSDLGAAITEAIGDSPDKVYAIYYGGRAAGFCGGARPGGTFAAVYVDREGCSDRSPGADPEVASTYEGVMVHELLHVFGAASPCPPHLEAEAHVHDDVGDVMYGGVEWESRGDVVIDAGRDDYFDHGRSDCLDTGDSPFWEPVERGQLDGREDGRPYVRIPVADWPLRCGLR